MILPYLLRRYLRDLDDFGLVPDDGRYLLTNFGLAPGLYCRVAGVITGHASKPALLQEFRLAVNILVQRAQALLLGVWRFNQNCGICATSF